ncbi:MAG: BrnT family toxin [Acidobacteria bacterium]|nr:BrnT family toxin [Acidobacteriota bacterium]
MEFVWDENKAEGNIKDHDGITFKQAAVAFYDEFGLDDFDGDHSSVDEKRYTRIGMSGLMLLRVTYTIEAEFPEETIRIISARKADSEEEKDYENNR